MATHLDRRPLTVDYPLRRNNPSLTSIPRNRTINDAREQGYGRSPGLTGRLVGLKPLDDDTCNCLDNITLRSNTPQMDTRPLRFAKPEDTLNATMVISPGRSVYGSLRSNRNPCPPKRKSSTGATLKRSYTVEGRGSERSIVIPQLDGGGDDLSRKKSSAVGSRGGMTWLQRPAERKTEKPKVIEPQDSRSSSPTVFSLAPTLKMRNRSFTDPERPFTSFSTNDDAAAEIKGDGIRTTSSAVRDKKSGTGISLEDNPDDSKDMMKKWKKRVMSTGKDLFRSETKVQKSVKKRSTSSSVKPMETSAKAGRTEKRNRSLSIPYQQIEPTAPSIHSDSSTQTVITRRSQESGRSSGSCASQAASTVSDWQVDGVKSPATYEELAALPEQKSKEFNDSVVGMIDGKVGGLTLRRRVCGRQWQPPILTLDMQVITPLSRLPVLLPRGREFWVAVVLQGYVAGDVDFSGCPPNACGIGLDVGVLLDISSYTSEESFIEMKAEARRLVEAMETSTDRIAVMTFSSPPIGRRKPSSRNGHVKLLNSTGSVAKKQLIEDIGTLTPGLQADPVGRDASEAVMEAVKTLHNMPADTSKYGSKRSGHLFVITSKLDNGAIKGDFGGVKVHVLGVGPIFTPTSSIGGKGWCVALSSPVQPIYGLRKIVADGVEIDVERPTSGSGVDVKEIISILRMGVDVGTIEQGNLMLFPGEGCKINGFLGDTSFTALLPGERRSLMVKVEAGDLPGFEADDIEGMERQLQATLGELHSTIITVEAHYQHSHFAVPGTMITTKATVNVARYDEGSVWSRSTHDIHDMPSFFTESDDSKNELVNAVLIQVLASRHKSARDARHSIEQLIHETDVPAVLRELGYQVYIEDRFAPRRIMEETEYPEPMMDIFALRYAPDSPSDDLEDPDITPRCHIAPTGEIIMRPRDFGVRRAYDAGTENRTPWSSEEEDDLDSLHVQSDSEIYVPSSRSIRHEQTRQGTPDEARKLWMRLGSGFEDNVSGNDAFRDLNGREVYYGQEQTGVNGRRGMRREPTRRMRANSLGHDTMETMETMVTYRDVRETDFSPWVL